MSDNVGLTTPRGSGTSGYVQRNLAHIRTRDSGAPYPSDLDSLRHKQRQPDKAILEHDRKREIEVQVFELRDQLEEEDLEEDEIEERCTTLRKKLVADSEAASSGNGRRGRHGGDRRDQQQNNSDSLRRKALKPHQVHELADAKIKESERLRQALGISKNYEEGGHWRRQEERMKKAVERNGAEAER